MRATFGGTLVLGVGLSLLPSGFDHDAGERALAARLGMDVAMLARVRAERGMTDAELLALPERKLLGLVRKTLSGDRPDEYALFRASHHRDATGAIPDGALVRSMEQMDRLAKALPLAVVAGLDSTKWTELGPGNIGGRIRAIAFHPTTHSTMWVGSASGGIFKSTDSGATWSKAYTGLENLAVTSIVLDPTNANRMLASTGEGFLNVDAIRGAGIFESTDGGATWAQLVKTKTTDFHYTNRLVISPDGKTMLAATGTGIFRNVSTSTDWTKVWPATGSARVLDVDFHPSDDQRAVASFVKAASAGVVYSDNNGAAFKDPTTNINATSNGLTGRAELVYVKGWTGDAKGCVYALQDYSSAATPRPGTLWRSTDGGDKFTEVSNPNPAILAAQGWYDNALWVEPGTKKDDATDDLVIAAGIDVYRSTDGGANFAKISDWASDTSIHGDHHAILPHPAFGGAAGKRVFVGCDGGIYKTDDIGAAAPAWSKLNKGLGITQFYGGSRNSVSGLLIGGAQDNGTVKLASGGAIDSWATVYGGDGGQCASDQADAKYHYGEYVHAAIYRSSDSAASIDYVFGGDLTAGGWVFKAAPFVISDTEAALRAALPDTTRANFIAPIALDPNDNRRILVGARSLWETKDAKTANTATSGPKWAAIKAPPGGATSANNVSAIAITRGKPDRLWVGHNNGKVYLQDETAVGTWVEKGAGTLPAGRIVTRLTIDPADEKRVFATFSSYADDNVWETTDSGASWTARKTTGVEVPVRDLKIHPKNPAWLYLATEAGLLASENGGAAWSAGASPTPVSIDELVVSDCAIWLVTHGRGMFTQGLKCASTTPISHGCKYPAGGATKTNLAGSLCVIGQPFTLTIRQALPGSPFLFIWSLPAASPFALSAECEVPLDLATMITVSGTLIGGAGTGTLVVPVPNVLSFECKSLHIQAAVVEPPATIVLTNAVRIVIGV